MTRVEKYHRYREEIANMKINDNSSKKLTSLKVEELRQNTSNSRLEYSQIEEAYKFSNKLNRKLIFNLNLLQLIGIIAILIAIIATIVLVIVL